MKFVVSSRACFLIIAFYEEREGENIKMKEGIKKDKVKQSKYLNFQRSLPTNASL